MFCVYTEVMAPDDTDFFLIKPRLIFSFYLCLRLTSPNYAFMRCRLYSTQKVIWYYLSEEENVFDFLTWQEHLVRSSAIIITYYKLY